MARSVFTDMKGPLSKALKRVASESRTHDAAALVPVWKDAAGEAMARCSSPVRLESGVLTVEAAPEFLFDLERAQATLIERLNEHLGRNAVRRIAFVRRSGQ